MSEIWIGAYTSRSYGCQLNACAICSVSILSKSQEENQPPLADINIFPSTSPPSELLLHFPVLYVSDSDAESCESWEGEALGIEECLFCSLVSDSIEKNVEHMTEKHSFFIPDAEFISNLEGLVVYLG